MKPARGSRAPLDGSSSGGAVDQFRSVLQGILDIPGDVVPAVRDGICEPSGASWARLVPVVLVTEQGMPPPRGPIQAPRDDDLVLLAHGGVDPEVRTVSVACGTHTDTHSLGDTGTHARVTGGTALHINGHHCPLSPQSGRPYGLFHLLFDPRREA